MQIAKSSKSQLSYAFMMLDQVRCACFAAQNRVSTMQCRSSRQRLYIGRRMMTDRKRRSAFAINHVAKENEQHVSDFYYAVEISARLLKPIGVWPLTDDELSSKLKIIVHRASTLIATFLFSFISVPWFVKIVKEKWNVSQILSTLCPLLFTVTVFMRYILLVLHRDQLKSCVDHVADDWRGVIIAEDRETMLENAKRGRTFGIVSVSFMYSCGVFFYALPITLSSIVNENNVTVRLHPAPSELVVFDTQISPVYEIVYVIQVLSGYTVYSTFSGICSLMANFVTHICGQCDVLMSIIEETVDGGKHTDGSIENRIGIAITRHLRLLRLVSDVSALFIDMCLVEFINSSCNICLLSYYIIIELNNNGSFVQIFMYVFGLASIIFNMFLSCYIGDLLTERCQNIGTTCYTIEWYRMPAKRAIELIMPITISRYPPTITAGKMISMTLTTFSNILKTSMAYVNLLREFSMLDTVRM